MTSISIHISCFVVFACLPYLWAKNALPFLERSLLLWEREEKDNESVQNLDEDESLAESPAATEGWTAWGPWLSCSRTCDGGIAISLRECRGKCPTGQPIRRQICNMQPCPEASDFRAAQCAAYDDRPYRGRKYSWVPFHDPEDPCALTCRARGYNFVAKHSKKVQDGTRCREGALDMCVDGQCQSIGCDLRVGSNLKVDECGICGGDGSTCQKPTFIWQEGDYGECSVTCGGGIQLSESFCRNKETNEEVDQRLCNLSIRPRTKAKHCNRFPCPVVWATGQWGPCSATCGPGVQSRPVFCVQGGPNGTQIDVKSEFCPRHKPMTERSCSIEECPRWFQGPWTPCSATCGTGVQNRAVVCRDTRSQYSDLCDPSDMPRRQRNCDARQPCPTTAPEESTTPPPCVYTPSTEGEIETTTTEEPTTPTMPVIILTQAPFNLTTEVRTFYFVGPWGRCNGQGYRRRIVHCQIYIDNSHTPAWLPDYECPEIRPADLEPCTVPCPPPHPPRQLESVREVEPPFVEKVVEVEEEKTFYSWNTEKFTPCSTTCGGGVHSSMVRCLRLPDEVEVSAQLCDLSLKPEPLTRKCNLQPCPQIYRWNATEFGNCSHECGGGTRKRLVKCILLTNGQEVTSVHCSGQPPTAIEQCNVFDCPPAWRAEQWSKCSKSCGGGFQTRKLHCEKVLAPLSQTIQLPPSKCLKTRPKAVKKCNLKPCPPPPRTTTTTSTTTTTTTTTTVAPTTDDVDDYEIVTNYPDEQVFVQKQPNRRVTLKASGQAILFKGSNAKFHCPVPQPLTPSLNTSLLSNPRVLWFKGHRRIPPQSANGWPRVAVSGKGALRIHKTTLADSGNYTCLAGAFRSDVLVKVRPLPARIHQENVLISTTSTTTDPSAETRNRKLTNRSALPQVRHFLVNMRHFAEERTRSRSDPVVLEYEWIIGVWSPCSHTCGKLGTQVRTIECQVRVLGNATRLVPRSLCEGGLEEPIAIRPCSLDPCPEWITGDWSECSLKNCLSWNISYQKRSVVCGIANITVTPSHCDANQRPRRKRECRHGLCRGHWKVGQWTECTAPCGHQGFRSRSVQCVWQGNQESAPTTACKSPSPPTSSSCGRTPCKDEEEVECYDQSTYCDVVKKAKLCQMSHFRIQCCASCSSQD